MIPKRRIIFPQTIRGVGLDAGCCSVESWVMDEHVTPAGSGGQLSLELPRSRYWYVLVRCTFGSTIHLVVFWGELGTGPNVDGLYKLLGARVRTARQVAPLTCKHKGNNAWGGGANGLCGRSGLEICPPPQLEQNNMRKKVSCELWWGEFRLLYLS